MKTHGEKSRFITYGSGLRKQVGRSVEIVGRFLRLGALPREVKLSILR